MPRGNRIVTDERRLTLAAMRERAEAIHAARRQARFDDFMFLVQQGTSVEDATKRVGTNPIALERQAHRWGRTDIVRAMGAAAYRQRVSS